MSVREALRHAGLALGYEVEIEWVHSAELEKGKGWEGVRAGARHCRAGWIRHRAASRARSPLRVSRARTRFLTWGCAWGCRSWSSSSVGYALGERGSQFHRVRPKHASPGDRPAAGAAGHRRHGRHHAPGALSLPSAAGQQGGPSLPQADRPGTPPPPLRVQQQLSGYLGPTRIGLLRAFRPTGGWWRSPKWPTTRSWSAASSIPNSSRAPTGRIRSFAHSSRRPLRARRRSGRTPPIFRGRVVISR